MKGQKISKEDGRRIEKALQAAKGDEELYRRIQMVHLRATQGMTQPVIAKACGVSLSTVNRAHMAWFAEGMDSFKVEPRDGRIRENMSLAEEKAFLEEFTHKAGAGELVCIQDIRYLFSVLFLAQSNWENRDAVKHIL